MSGYQGDIALGQTIDIKFNTYRPSTGASFTLAGSPVVAAYVGNSTTEITAGITLTVDFDSRTGYHNVRVVATSGNGFAAQTDISLSLTAGTVDSVSIVGAEIGSFSIENRAALRPTVAGRTVDVTATGAAGIDWANVENPTTALNLSGTNIDVDQVVASVSGAVGSVTGAVGSVTGAVGSVTGAVGSVTGNVGGNVTGTVGSVIGAVGSVTGNVGGNVVGSVASVAGAVGSVTGNVGGNVVGSVGSVVGAVGSVTAGVTVTTNNDKTGYAIGTGGIDAAAFAAAAITASAIAANALGASELAADAAEKIADALLNRNVAGASNAGRLVKEALYSLRNKVEISGGTLTIYAVDDTTPAWTAAVTTAAGDPLTEIDPT